MKFIFPKSKWRKKTIFFFLFKFSNAKCNFKTFLVCSLQTIIVYRIQTGHWFCITNYRQQFISSHAWLSPSLSVSAKTLLTFVLMLSMSLTYKNWKHERLFFCWLSSWHPSHISLVLIDRWESYWSRFIFLTLVIYDTIYFIFIMRVQQKGTAHILKKQFIKIDLRLLQVCIIVRLYISDGFGIQSLWQPRMWVFFF